MSAQDNTERVLRSLHILLSRSEVYPKEPSKVLVDRDQMVGLLNDLTQCIYDMMGEYEITQDSKNQAAREFQKQGDEIVLKASHRAEDVYAASVMYTDEALNSIQDIMDNTSDTMRILFEEMERRMKEEKQNLRSNQLELRSQLQDLADTDKYLKIIDDRNRQIQKEKAAQKSLPYEAEEKNLYADRQTGIKINEEYFAMMGIPLEDDLDQEPEPVPQETVLEAQAEKPVKKRRGGFWKNTQEPEPFPQVQDLSLDDEITDLGLVLDNPAAGEPDSELAQRAAEAQVRLNLDADYFKWKEQQEAALMEQNAPAVQPNPIAGPEEVYLPDPDMQGLLEDDLYSEATREADKELTEGIHEIWKIMTESLKDDPDKEKP